MIFCVLSWPFFCPQYISAKSGFSIYTFVFPGFINPRYLFAAETAFTLHFHPHFFKNLSTLSIMTMVSATTLPFPAKLNPMNEKHSYPATAPSQFPNNGLFPPPFACFAFFAGKKTSLFPQFSPVQNQGLLRQIKVNLGKSKQNKVSREKIFPIFHLRYPRHPRLNSLFKLATNRTYFNVHP